VDPAVLYRRIRRRVDLLDGEFIQNDEIGELAEESYFDLWDFLLDLLGDEGPWELATLSTVANQPYIDIALTTGCYRMLRLDAALDGNAYVPIERGQLGSDPWQVSPEQWQRATDVKYYARRGARASAASRLGSADSFAAWRLYFSRTPTAVHSVRLFYLPPPPIVLTDDDPATYTSFPDEWPEYVVADVAAKIAVRQESDPAPHERERERVRERIERYSKPHQVTQARKIVDARRWQAGELHEDDDGFRRR
jgi:hypothetical protein